MHLESASGIVRIPFYRLEFLEVVGKKLFFHLMDGSVKEIYGSLSDFKTKLLCREEFIRACLRLKKISNNKGLRALLSNLNARENACYP